MNTASESTLCSYHVNALTDVCVSVLALQNLEATLPKKDTDQAVELGALKASLSMMSKVLSDILDL